MKKERMTKKLIMVVPILIGIILIILFTSVRVLKPFEKGEEKTITSSTLMETINISYLSTAQFTYNGIAEIYKDEEKKKVKCYIRYNAKVKAGIDMSNVDFKIDYENMTVRPILPEVKITANPVDETTLSFIPADTTIELSEALIACKEDAEREALESSELLESAEENVKSIIEALLYPVLTPQGYTITWK